MTTTMTEDLWAKFEDGWLFKSVKNGNWGNLTEASPIWSCKCDEAKFFLVAGVDKTRHLHSAVWEGWDVHQGKLVSLESTAAREQVTQRGASLSLEFSKTQLDKSRANLTQCGDEFCGRRREAGADLQLPLVDHPRTCIQGQICSP